MTQLLLLSQKHLEWHENSSESIVRKSRGWLRIALQGQDMKGLSTKQMDGLKYHGQVHQEIADLEERT